MLIRIIIISKVLIVDWVNIRPWDIRRQLRVKTLLVQTLGACSCLIVLNQIILIRPVIQKHFIRHKLILHVKSKNKLSKLEQMNLI